MSALHGYAPPSPSCRLRLAAARSLASHSQRVLTGLCWLLGLLRLRSPISTAVRPTGCGRRFSASPLLAIQSLPQLMARLRPSKAQLESIMACHSLHLLAEPRRRRRRVLKPSLIRPHRVSRAQLHPLVVLPRAFLPPSRANLPAAPPALQAVQQAGRRP